jgi:glycosyltransferase involved in cell wall biosynthesis
VKKLLWVGDICAATGFARVSHSLLTRIQDKFNIVVLGSNYHGDPHSYQFPIYPATNRYTTTSYFGEERIREVVVKEKPDIIFCINDSWIINDLYSRIKDLHEQGLFKFVGYYPVDGINWFNTLSVIANQWDQVYVYTEFGCVEAVKAGLKHKPIRLPHGVDTSVFYPQDKLQCRKKLGLPEDKFIVFNGNRNQPRKRIDLTIRAFAQFAVDASNAILYLHMGSKDIGWDVKALFGKEMHRYGLDPARRIVLSGKEHKGIQNASIELLRDIYCSADVGVNTCEGEGWGLVNFEHAACGVAQIVPNHTSCKEIFEGYGDLIDVEHTLTDKDFGREMFCVNPDSLASILYKHYSDREYNQTKAESCFQRVINPGFNWDNIANKLAYKLSSLFQVDEPVSNGFKVTSRVLKQKKKSKAAH